MSSKWDFWLVIWQLWFGPDRTCDRLAMTCQHGNDLVTLVGPDRTCDRLAMTCQHGNDLVTLVWPWLDLWLIGHDMSAWEWFGDFGFALIGPVTDWPWHDSMGMIWWLWFGPDIGHDMTAWEWFDDFGLALIGPVIDWPWHVSMGMIWFSWLTDVSPGEATNLIKRSGKCVAYS